MVIEGYNCGKRCKSKLMSMGLVKGKDIRIVCKEPHGPYVIDLDGHQIAIGQKLFEKIKFSD